MEDLDFLASTSNASIDATTIGFTVYTTATLPTKPAPPAACASALVASINCNSTIPLMALVARLYAPTLAIDSISGPYTSQCLKDPTSGDYCSAVIAGYHATNGIPSLPNTELCSYCVFATMNATLFNAVSYSTAIEQLYDYAAAKCGLPAFNPTSISSPIVSPGTPVGVNSTSTVSPQCAMLGRNVTTTAASSCAAVAAQFSVSLYDVYSSNSLQLTNCTVAASTTLCLPQACTTYTVKTNDTCLGVANAANITTVQLQLYNPSLGTTCQYIPQQVGNLICVGPHGGFPNSAATSAAIAPSGTATALAAVPTPTAAGSTAACGEWAVAVAGDFCSTFALRYAVTLADLYLMNPEINANCTNLLAAFYYCVEPYPPFSTVTTTASSVPTGTNYTTISTFSYSFPAYTATTSYEILTTAGVPAPTNVAPGTRTAACGYYYNISGGDTLASIANISDNAEADLISWNSELTTAVPAVGKAICVIFPTGNYTLVAATPPENVSPFATTACSDYHTAVVNDTCTSIAAGQDISSTQFLALNPGLTCAGLLAGVAYCDFPLTPIPLTLSTGPPSNLASGSFTNCTTYYTVASGDSCGSIETKFNITLADIIAWNPFLTSSCAIQIGENLCVAGTPPATSTGPPANLAAGSLSNCTTYYTIASGDICASVDAKFDIALADFLRWNTALTAACTSIELNEAYCVAGGGNACTKIYTVSVLLPAAVCCRRIPKQVASGDSCGSIETKFSITLADIIAWNPFLTSSCAIQIGMNLCVAGAPPSGTGPPANIAAGTLKNCTTYYTVNRPRSLLVNTRSPFPARSHPAIRVPLWTRNKILRSRTCCVGTLR
ncbi:hypothetical protein GGX14DRAFT_374627 [Mycena pura]|uniref:LysM domain-containing protein n=1 Tax=Mycena pura TaxID=153505 RepID=A0AAD6V135_9AGAR|nr:hypothetical protein GGX14DRAFT_374627 [Mycena pura]